MAFWAPVLKHVLVGTSSMGSLRGAEGHRADKPLLHWAEVTVPTAGVTVE